MPPEHSSEAGTLKPKFHFIIVAAALLMAASLVFIAGKKEQFAVPSGPTSLMQEVQVKDIIAQGYRLNGRIDAIDQEEKTLSILVKVPDLSGLSKNDKVILRELPVIQKTYFVNTTAKTTFDGKFFSDLQTGDTVIVQTKESIYETDMPTATSITYWDEQKEQLNNVLGDTHILFGSVRSETTTNNITVLTVESEIPDKEKLLASDLSSGSYVVPYITRIFRVTLPVPLIPRESLLGRMVRIKTTEDIYESTALEATEILFVP